MKSVEGVHTKEVTDGSKQGMYVKESASEESALT